MELEEEEGFHRYDHYAAQITAWLKRIVHRIPFGNVVPEFKSEEFIIPFRRPDKTGKVKPSAAEIKQRTFWSKQFWFSFVNLSSKQIQDVENGDSNGT